MLWIYDLPTWLVAILIIGGITLLSIAGLYASRRWVEKTMGPAPGHNEGVEAYIATVAVFYALVVGLIAVAVWEQYTRIDEDVTREAASLAALYRIAEGYPDPYGPKLTTAIRDYTRYVIDVAWPAQRKGIVAHDPANHLSAIQEVIYAFRPVTPHDQLIDERAMSEMDAMYEMRRLRLHNVDVGLPYALWLVVLLGGAITIVLTYFMALERFNVHVWMTAFTAAMVALVVFMIVVVDHPFRGEVSIGPDAFELIYDQLMSQESKLNGVRFSPSPPPSALPAHPKAH